MCLEYPNSWISCPQGILLFTKCCSLLEKYFKKTSNRVSGKKYEEKPELLAQHTYVTWFWTYFFLTFGKLNVFFLFVWKTSPSSFKLVDLLILSKWTLLPFLALKNKKMIFWQSNNYRHLSTRIKKISWLKRRPKLLTLAFDSLWQKKIAQSSFYLVFSIFHQESTLANISTFHKLNNENS